MKTVALATLGCKVNQAETDRWARDFRAAGYDVVPFERGADIVVINTCTVTHVADRKSRQIIRQARRWNRAAMLVVAGCYANIAPDEVRSLPRVDMVVEGDDKKRLVEMVLSVRGNNAERTEQPVPSARTRTMLKIQDGCTHFCTYCIVPYARGPEVSTPADQVLAEVRDRVLAGHKEIVLSGVRLGAYGQDLPDGQRAGLAELVSTILAEVELPRLRLSSIEPEDFAPEMAQLWQDKHLCRHLHLPLQSGSDAVLKRMGRGYDTAQFANAVADFRRHAPNGAVTTDVIVGFPGETEREFDETYRFCQEMDLAGIHVFQYSARAGTVAARMPDQVPPPVKKQRSDAILVLAAESALRYRRRFLGQILDTLYETDIAAGSKLFWEGITDNYLRVFTRSEEDLGNKLLPTRLVGDRTRGLVGELAAVPT